jgi:uncharacterized membrane protein YkoI
VRHLPVVALLTAFGLGSGAPAWALDLNQDQALQLRQQGVILPLEELIQKAMALYPGARLLEAELERHDHRYIYEVELLTPSQVVREIKLDAVNGSVIEDKEDD